MKGAGASGPSSAEWPLRARRWGVAGGEALVCRGQDLAGRVVVDQGRGRDHAASRRRAARRPSSRSSPHPIARSSGRLAGRQDHRRRDRVELVDVVAEPRAVDELDPGEQRVVGRVPAMRGDVEDVDVGGQLAHVARRGRRRPARSDRRPTTLIARVDLLGGSVDPRAGHEAGRPYIEGSASAVQPTIVADRGTVSGRPAKPGSSVHGTPASEPAGTITEAPIADVWLERCRPSRSARAVEPSSQRVLCIASCKSPGQPARRPCRGRPASRRAATCTSAKRAEVDDMRSLVGNDEGVEPLLDDEIRHQRATDVAERHRPPRRARQAR